MDVNRLMNEDWVRLLYYPPSAGAEQWKPYYVYKWCTDGWKDRIKHFPGVSKSVGWHVNQPPSAIGLRGMMVKYYDQPLPEQDVLLRWAGVDIDAKDNPSVSNLPAYVNGVLHNVYPVVVRTSKSGAGCHVFLRLSDMGPCNYDTARILASAAANVLSDFLATKDVTCCVKGLPNLWVWGGKQVTLSQCPATDFYLPSRDLSVGKSYRVYSEGVVPVELFDGLPAKALYQLMMDGVVPQVQHSGPAVPGRVQVNVGRVKRSLEKVGIKFATRSSCREEHEHEVSGFMELSMDGQIRLYANADQSYVLTLNSL